MGIVGAVVGLAMFGALFGLLERFFPGTRAPRERGSRWVDLCFFALAQITQVIGKGAVILTIALFALALGWRGMPFESWLAMRTRAFGCMPHALQVVVALLLIDFYGYWIHRMLHMRGMWRFHSIHHSSTRLDWLAAVREHPIADLFGRVVIIPPLLGLGIDAQVVAGILPVVGIWGVFVHANVRWTFGPLRYVIATPLFHRWHHASDPEAIDKNFGGLFPIWDLIFGTFHCPLRQPAAFGAKPVPSGFFAQIAYPFQKGALDRRGR